MVAATWHQNERRLLGVVIERRWGGVIEENRSAYVGRRSKSMRRPGIGDSHGGIISRISETASENSNEMASVNAHEIMAKNVRY